MEIGPLKDGRPVTDRPAEVKEKPKEPPKTEVRQDSVELSAEVAQRLESDSREPIDLAKISNRIESGFYESPQVRDKVIDRLTDELLKNIREFYK